MINVTKSFLPPIGDYSNLLTGIWERGHLTNHGPLVNELEEKLKNYLGVKHLFYTSNGTIALQIAIKALQIEGEVITTPFSYVASTSSIVWENATPVFVDIEPKSLTIDPNKIEALISDKTTAILATHVFGIPCDVEKIKQIAQEYNLKVIYDAAHAFAVKYKGTQLMNYGDVSTISFHATKIFHTIEGGAVATNDDGLAHRISYMRNFGHKGQEDFWGLGINGKNSEFHAAMGLCIWPYLDSILEKRQHLSNLYSKQLTNLNGLLEYPVVPPNTDYNYSYFPVLFSSEKKLLSVKDALNALNIYPRRYFYPSLHSLPYLQNYIQSLPIVESATKRILCLPLFHDLSEEDVKRICKTVETVLNY